MNALELHKVISTAVNTALDSGIPVGQIIASLECVKLDLHSNVYKAFKSQQSRIVKNIRFDGGLPS